MTMTKSYNIYGAIVDSDIEKESADDITLSDFSQFVQTIEDGDSITFNLNSPGGSVTTGIAIANQIRQLSKRGIKTTAKVEGICASIATVIMCACDDIVMNDSSFVMIHNCWSIVQGDANTLRKEADTMERMNKAILSFYRSKFDLTDEELQSYMDAETWFSGNEANDFNLRCQVVHSDEPMKIAASISKKNFKNLPKEIYNMTEEEKKECEVPVEEEETEELEEENKESIEKSLEEVENGEMEQNGEEVKEEEAEVPEETDEGTEDEDVEALKSRIAELEEKLRKYEEEPVEDRVRGMQSKMQARINDCEKSYKAQIKEFENKLEMKDRELESIKEESISLKNSLEETARELSEKISALDAKESALNSLHQGVLASPEPKKDWKNLTGKEFWDYLKENPEIAK